MVWVVYAIEEKLFSCPEEGGTLADSINYREELTGEKLLVLRNAHPPGYDLTHLDRELACESNQSQLSSEKVLFEESGMALLKNLAKQPGEWQPA